MEKIKITLDETHPSLNVWTRWHWTKKSAVKKSFENQIIWLAGKYNEPKLTNCDVKVIYYFEKLRTRDKDNYVPKFILDGLVKGGILNDDNDNEIYLNWELREGEKEKTEIFVTPRAT